MKEDSVNDRERMNYWWRRAKEAESLVEGLRLETTNHPEPECDEHIDDGITCGWKRAYSGMLNILKENTK